MESKNIKVENIEKNAKIISWNCNGLRSILKKNLKGEKQKNLVTKNLLDNLIRVEKPDILCLQEIRCSNDFIWNPHPSLGLSHVYTNCATSKKGYSGTIICSRIKPIRVIYDVEGIDEKEGRVITLEFDNFYIINMYSPNSGRQKERLVYKTTSWINAISTHVKNLNATDKKHIVLVGDLNVAHETIDNGLGRIVAGAHLEERKTFTEFLTSNNLIDTFRLLHPTTRKYSWFSPAGLLKNQGIRLDYALVSNKDIVHTSDILLNYLGSDHFPLLLEIK